MDKTLGELPITDVADVYYARTRAELLAWVCLQSCTCQHLGPGHMTGAAGR